MPDETRPTDIVLYGATGFVGRLTARYLAAHAPAGTAVTIAGRSRARLEEVKARLGAGAAGWQIAVADAGDPEALADLAGRTRVVATTVGPYARYGRELLGACAAAGTHYADLTGEVLFVRESIERFHDAAVRSGARLVHSCGYDSIPSDLGMLLVKRAADEAGAGGVTESVLAARMRGGLSGGTLDSMRAQLEALESDPSLRPVIADPYALSPDRAGEPDLGRQPDTFAPRTDPVLREWTAPFVMAPYNTRVVRRSNALTGWSYGRGLRYREVMAFGRSPLGALAAGGLAAGLAGLMAAARFAPARTVLDRLAPSPGSGPSQATMDRGWFRSDVVALTESGQRFGATVSADADPGYKGTATMLGESALALALDAGSLPEAAGVLTPATGIGHVLVERLRQAGFRLEATRQHP